jgi:hypothetical protein
MYWQLSFCTHASVRNVVAVVQLEGEREEVMCTGIALAASELPLGMLEQPRLKARLFARGGELEVRFFFLS